MEHLYLPSHVQELGLGRHSVSAEFCELLDPVALAHWNGREFRKTHSASSFTGEVSE